MRHEHRDTLIVIGLAACLAACLVIINSISARDDAPGGVTMQSGPDLRLAPWAQQPDGSPTIDASAPWPSLVFPAGTGYSEALRQLYVASRTDGRVPATARVAPALPAEVVLVQPDDPAQGARVSLLAPWGWDDDGRRIRPPSFSIPAGLPRREESALIEAAMRPTAGLPAQVRVDVPELPPCQIAVGTPDRRPSCA